MTNFISIVLGMLIFFPFLVTLLVLIFFRKRGKAPVKVMGIAADITTPFLFIAVYIISRQVFGEGTGFYITAIAIVITILFAVIERMKVRNFEIIRLLRKSWRLLFLLLVVTYIILLILGVILKIVEYAH